MDTLIIIFNISIFIIIGGLYAFMPSFMNRYLLFGNSVNDEILADEEIIRIKRSYRVMSMLVSLTVLVAYALTAGLLDAGTSTIIYVVLIFLQIIVTYLLYFKAHYDVKTIKTSHQYEESTISTIDTSESREFKVISSLSYLLYLFIIVGLVFLSLDRYPDLPQRIATHFDSNGVANGFSEKSYWFLMSMPIMMVLMTLIFIGVNYSLKKAKKVSGVVKEKVTFEQENKFRYLWSVAIYAMGLMIMILFVIIQLSMIQIINSTSVILVSSLSLTGLMLIMMIGLSVYTGQSGSRLKTEKKVKEVVDRADDSNWKAGLYYVNRNDPSLFVPKRFGIGMTLNFGNPLSWIVMLIIIGFILFSILSGGK
ncbi:MAG: DUF1648 domain-containing protein [Clostridia bacterium]|nr:DUF1648 domain-containing protein [Clostridia bacterium]